MNDPRTGEYFRDMVVCVVTGSRYLDSFIGEPAMKKAWINKKVKGWTKSVEILARVAHEHQQTDYADKKNSLQQE